MEKKSTNIITQISLITILAVITLGCGVLNGVQTKSQLDTLTGQNISSALRLFGPPTYTNDDGQGGKIYTWIYDKQGGTLTTYNRQYSYAISSTDQYHCEKHVYANADGIIYYSKWKGNRCE